MSTRSDRRDLARKTLRASGIDLSKDFDTLRFGEVDTVLDVAKMLKYKKSKNAPGSTACMFWKYVTGGDD